MPNQNITTQFINGELSVNEYTVYIAAAVLANPESRLLSTSTTELSVRLGNTLSRHAVARSLRNLQKKSLIEWNTKTGSRNGVIAVR